MKKSSKLFLFALLCLAQSTFYGKAQHENPHEKLPRTPIWGLYELTVENNKTYKDPFRDVELTIELTNPVGKKYTHYGFYDGENGWKIRFSPNEEGIWRYKVMFSDSSNYIEDIFICGSTDKKGRVTKNKYNPFWLGRGISPKYLFRSFHVGDAFFADNWDDPNNPDDGELRTKFLDWLQKNKYNMLSIASHYTNRDAENRGQGWGTPQVWPINPKEYRKMETILDELNERDITVFPFAGFFGAKGNWPTDKNDQEIYVKYVLARIGHYPNIILNVAGPEPFWKEEREQYQGAMRMVDILRLGALIDSLDTHDHILTVHNEKRATQYGDPFIDEPWLDMSTLQGPTTINREELFSGLVMNHHRYKPTYAQETLWAGNKYHPQYTDDQLRKNVYTILFSGSILNFADMNGNSSSGFSGTMDLEQKVQHKHDIVNEIWDWFETIPFHQMTSRQDMVKQGFCLANEGVEYYVYLDTVGEVELFLDFPYMLKSEWINAKNTGDVRTHVSVNKKTVFKTPTDGDDWILHVYAPKVKNVAEGNFPDIAVDNDGNLHLVYNRDGLFYKKYDAKTKTWSNEQNTGCHCGDTKQSDPDVVTDSEGNPHVYCGKEYAQFNGKKWQKSTPGSKRDTELIIDSKDNIYLVHRWGNNGGNIGFLKKEAHSDEWKPMTDPDQKHLSGGKHVYTDICVDNDDKIHLVQRHGPEVEVTYRSSIDGGQTWPKGENVMDERSEAPHIAVTKEGIPFISTGKGYVLERQKDGSWKQHGRKLHTYARMHPELGVDRQNNVYQTSFGGHYNILYKDVWMGEKQIDPINENKQIGFVETSGANDFVYVVWEEGEGNQEEGLHISAEIYVGILYPDGRLVGLF